MKRVTLFGALFFFVSAMPIFSQTDDDDYVIIDGERRLLMRLEFVQDETNLTETTAAALAELAQTFADGEMRRYEIHGHYCAGVDGSRAIAMSRAEFVVQHILAQGVFEGNILSLVNPTTARYNDETGCVHDKRVDIMAIDRRRVHKDEVTEVAVTVDEPVIDEAPDTDDMTDLMARGRETFAEPEPAAPIAPRVPAPALPATDGERKTVAVYMAGEEPQGVRGVHNILGGELARVISESESYLAVDRTDFILEQLERELEYQMSGMVDDEQITAIGRQLGVQYLCISHITPIGNKRAFYLDARLVDVETAELIRSVTANSNLRDANEMMRVGREIALELIETDRTRAERLRRKKMFRYIAIGLDVLGAGAIAYGIYENSNVVSNVDGGTYTEAERAVTRRNVGYIVGGALIASGVTVHILF